MTAVPVSCPCGWRGRRKPGACACYDEWAMYCRCTWGSCLKCGGRVEPVAWRRLCRETARRTKAWISSAEGRETMRELDRRFGFASKEE